MYGVFEVYPEVSEDNEDEEIFETLECFFISINFILISKRCQY